MIFQRRTSYCISSFVICSFVLLPLGRAAELPAQAQQRPENSNRARLNQVMQRAGYFDPLPANADPRDNGEFTSVEEAIHFLLDQAEEGMSYLNNRVLPNPSYRIALGYNGDMSPQANQAYVDSLRKTIADAIESTLNNWSDDPKQNNAHIGPAIKALINAKQVAYMQYQNDHYHSAQLGDAGTRPDDSGKQKERVVAAQYAILSPATEGLARREKIEQLRLVPVGQLLAKALLAPLGKHRGTPSQTTTP